MPSCVGTIFRGVRLNRRMLSWFSNWAMMRDILEGLTLRLRATSAKFPCCTTSQKICKCSVFIDAIYAIVLFKSRYLPIDDAFI